MLNIYYYSGVELVTPFEARFRAADRAYVCELGFNYCNCCGVELARRVGYCKLFAAGGGEGIGWTVTVL